MLTLDDWLEGLASSRSYFLRHLKDLPDEAWTYKPSPEVKTILETLVHLRVDDEAALQSLISGSEPDYDGISEARQATLADGRDVLLENLAVARADLVDYLRDNYADAPGDTTVSIWGTPMPLFRGVAYYSSEDYYHAGQVAAIRMAVEPDWNYYTTIYGG